MYNKLTYSKVLHKKYDPKLEDKAQLMEILLSNDFDKLNLDQLLEVNKKYLDLQSSCDKAISWSDEQYKAWQYMHIRIKEELNKNDTVKLGDVFHSSWGYEQTNTEFFKVIEINKSGKTCKVIQIGSISIGDEKKNNRNMCDSIIPDPDNIVNGVPCQVKIERSHERNPWNNKVLSVGEILLRGSVFYAGNNKHLLTLYRVKGECYRSWYA